MTLNSPAPDPHPVLPAETAAGTREAAACKVLVFGFDAAEAAQIKRMHSYLDCGFEVLGLTMRRKNMNRAFTPFWDNIQLGETQNEAIGQRLVAIAATLPVLWRNRQAMRGADVIVARNLDMMLVAVLARWVVGGRLPLIYECLDIHGIMTSPGAKGKAARWLERWVLRRTAALVVSSPAFVREYFAPVQGWQGPVSLIENKLWSSAEEPRRPTPRQARAPDAARPIVLGWVGTLRCAASLAILAQTAEQLGAAVEIRMYGVVHHHALPDFDAVVAAHPNITYVGPYEYPQGLARVYGECDVNWAQDLWQWGANSEWLLPNRIYEAGFFGCPSIAVAGSETGRRVADGLGWTVPEPSAAALVTLLRGLSRGDLDAMRDAVLRQPESRFRQSVQEIRAAILGPLQQG